MPASRVDARLPAATGAVKKPASGRKADRKEDPPVGTKRQEKADEAAPGESPALESEKKIKKVKKAGGDKKTGKKPGKKGDKKDGKKRDAKAGKKRRTARFDAADVPDAAVGTLIEVRQSGVHGKGVFALAPIKRRKSIIEYVGRIMSHKKADRLPPIDPDEPNHTFFFQIRDGSKVIDAAVGGSAARWINHSCAPNCEAEEDEDGRVFIRALRKIAPGEELFYDYGLVLDEPYTKKLRRDYACRCGASACRGMMLAPKD